MYSCGGKVCGSGRQIRKTAGGAHSVSSFVHRTESKLLTARNHTKTAAFKFHKGPSEFGQASQGRVAGRGGKAACESGCPAAEMFAKELLLCLAAEGMIRSI